MSLPSVPRAIVSHLQVRSQAQTVFGLLENTCAAVSQQPALVGLVPSQA